MVLFIKYPFTQEGLDKNKVKFIQCDKIEDHGSYIIVFPKTWIENGKVIYTKENKVGFYCKSIKHSDILKFKGGFGIEKCSKAEWQAIGRKWYFETKQKLPRKLKKKIIGKKIN